MKIRQLLMELSQSAVVTALNEKHGIKISIGHYDKSLAYQFILGEKLWSRSFDFPIDTITITATDSEDYDAFRQTQSAELTLPVNDVGASYGHVTTGTQDSLDYWLSEDGETYRTIDW